MNLTPHFPRDAVALLTACACAHSPKSSAPLDPNDVMAEAKARPAHGWVGRLSEDGRRWYTFVAKDAHGFEVSGKSGPTPPPDIDLATIPILPPLSQFPYAVRLLQLKRLVNGFYPDSGINVSGMTCRVAGALDDTDRQALSWKLHVLGAILADDHYREFKDAFLGPLRGCVTAPEAMGGGKSLVNWEMAGRLFDPFSNMMATQRRCMMVDVRVDSLFRLLAEIVKRTGPGSQAASGMLFGFVHHIAGFGGIVEPGAQLQIAMMYARKMAGPEVSRSIAQGLIEEAEDSLEQAKGAPSVSAMAPSLFAAVHAAWLAMNMLRDLDAAFPKADPMIAKEANVAEEWVVRATKSLENAYLNLEGLKYGSHRFGLVKALRVGGAALRDQKLFELIEQYVFYPRVWADALRAPAPLQSNNEDELGRAYLAEYFHLSDYATA